MLAHKYVKQRDEVAELREQLADAKYQLDGYKQKYHAALRFVDEAFQPHGKSEPILTDYSWGGSNKFEAVPRLARDYAELKQQLAEVTRERDEAKTCLEKFMGLIETNGKYGLLCDGTYPYATVTDAMQAAHKINCEQLAKHQDAEYTFRQKCHELERQLATVQAESAAMRAGSD